MPFDNIAKRHFDSGDYPEALRRAVEAIGFAKVRERQQRGEPDGRRIGVGFAMYSEQAGHGTSVYAAWGIPLVPGHEQCAGALHAGRRAGTADRRAQPRPGARDHAVAGGAFDPRRAARSHPPGARRHRRDALLHGHLGLALHDHVGRRRRRRVRRAGRAACSTSAPSCCRPSARRCASRPARWWARRGASPSPTWRAPGIAGRRICPATSTRAAWR